MDFFFLHKKNDKIVLEMHDLQKFSYAFLPIDLDFWPNTAKALEELLKKTKMNTLLGDLDIISIWMLEWASLIMH